MSTETERETTTMSWKVEPLSPSGTPPPIYVDDEEWLCYDQKPAILGVDGLNVESVGIYEQEQLTRAQVATKFLEELELKTWVKEESFADWFEEKIDIPIFEELPAPECGQNRAAVIYSSLPKLQLQPTTTTTTTNAAVQHHQQEQVLIQQQQHHHHHHHHQNHHHNTQNVDATQTLLREFETVLGDVEACQQITSMALTPPQSPPPTVNNKQHNQQLQQHFGTASNTAAHLLVSLQPLHHQRQHEMAFLYEQQQQQQESVEVVPSIEQQQQQIANNNYVISSFPIALKQQQQQQQTIEIAEHWSAENLSLVPLVHGTDVANELAKVDEYVRNCADDVNHHSSVVADQLSSSASSSFYGGSTAPPSPCTSSNASCISSEDLADDPDWSLEPSNNNSSRSSIRGRNGDSRRVGQTKRGGRRATGSKPYSRPNVEDKRVRKKEQNKNAATRYRQKKKQEIKEILGEEHELAEKNEELQDKVKNLQREIGYLKGFMRDVFRAKGLIK